MFSKRLAREKRKEEQELNQRYQEFEEVYQKHPNEANKLKRDEIKQKLESLYEIKVDGLVVRSRARWHEGGEKNGKYFLGLEKRNGVKKHIRKLFLSGVLMSDPYEILNGQKQFYSKLYQSNESELNKNCLDTFFLMKIGFPNCLKNLNARVKVK